MVCLNLPLSPRGFTLLNRKDRRRATELSPTPGCQPQLSLPFIPSFSCSLIYKIRIIWLTYYSFGTCHLSPWCQHPLTKVGRPGTHPRGAWARCRCCPQSQACCSRVGPSPGCSGSSGCCCRPGVRAGKRRQHPGEFPPPTGPAAGTLAEEPQNPGHTYPVAIALLPAAFGFKEGGVPALPLEANLQ